MARPRSGKLERAPKRLAVEARTRKGVAKSPRVHATRGRKRPRSGLAPGSLLTPHEIDEVFSRFQKLEPQPKTELRYRDPFTLLVAVVLSAQATDSSVNEATPRLFQVADTPAKLLALGEQELAEKIKTIGIYRNKSRNLIALARKLVEDFGGKVPRDRDSLESLPGVGRKTANVVLNVAFGEPTIAVDTHIFRVSNRTGLAPGKTPLEVEFVLNEVVPERFKHNCHHWLILHGRYVCKARIPECWRCLINDICLYQPKTPPPKDCSTATSVLP